jgi:hypothetical protein
MESKRFDDVARALGGDGASRRSLLRRVVGGGLAAAVAGIGLSLAASEDADAGRRGRRRRRKRRRRGGSGGGGTTVNAGYSVTVNNAGLLGTTCTTGDLAACGGPLGGLLCAAGICILSPATLLGITPAGGCTTGAQCPSGACQAGQCVNCDTIKLCGTGSNRQCCVVNATCVNNLCVLQQ